MKYFIAAVGMGVGVADAQQQTMLDYWWVMPEERPENAPRVIRVIGAKGESYEEVYSAHQQEALRQNPAIIAARLERQKALRREATEEARRLMEADEEMRPSTAYAEAWARVFSRRWLTANRQTGSCALEDMLLRVASEAISAELTPQEEQWVLEALLEDDDRLDSKEGRKLLELLARRLREQGYGLFYSPIAVNDELMKHFAEAMRSGYAENSVGAYRDALFKTYRHRIMRHQIAGYRAPWGVGMGGTGYYQAPQQITTTVATANTPAVAPAFTAGMNPRAGMVQNFLASSPDLVEEEEDEDDDDEEKEAENDTDDSTLISNPTGGSASAPPRMMMMRSMSLRSASAAVVAVADDGVSPLAENAIVSGTNTNTSFHTNTTVDGYVLTNGNRYGATWTPTYKADEKSNGYYTVDARVDYSTWLSGQLITETPDSFYLAGGNLYLGTGYQGNIDVRDTGSVLHAESLEHEYEYDSSGFWIWKVEVYVHAVYQVAGTGVFNYGTLSGSGDLTLANNAASGSTVTYRFNDAAASAEDWFAGTIKFGASQGGAVQLDLTSGAWANTVFDMTGIGIKTVAYGITTSTKPGSVALNVYGDVAIAGLRGGDATSTVKGNSGYFYDLTLGDSAGNDYVYSGTFTHATDSALDLIKVGENQQTYTNSINGNLHSVTVQGGVLRFDSDDSYGDDVYNQSVSTQYVTVSGGALLVNDLNVNGPKLEGAELSVTGGAIRAKGDINVTHDAGIGGGGQVSAANMTVGANLVVTGTGSSLAIADTISTNAMSVRAGAQVTTQHVTVAEQLQIGSAHQFATEVSSATLTSRGDLSANSLHLFSDGQLVTGNSAATLSEAHMYGGAIWEMQGNQNNLEGILRLYNIGYDSNTGTAPAPVILTNTNKVAGNTSGKPTEGSAVLTLPGQISLADANWTNFSNNALFELNGGVVLDFSRGVTLTGLTFDFTGGESLLFASTVGDAGWFDSGTDWVRIASNDDLWHGKLGYANGDIIITLEHKIEQPVVVGTGNLLYIEMYEDAYDPALPYKAHDKYSGSWSGTPDGITSMLKFSNVQLQNNSDLYLGEDKRTVGTGETLVDFRADRHFGGNIEVASGTARLHGEIGTWGNWNLDGHLGGSGELRLFAHHSNDGDGDSVTAGSTTTKPDDDTTLVQTTTVHGNASTFTFTDTTTPEQWFRGTVSMANTGGGIVQLNIGNVNVSNAGDTRWQNAVIDLNVTTDTDVASNETGSAAELVLGVMGDATVAGITGESENSSIVSNVREGSSRPSPVLTVGDSAGSDYTFAGTVGKGEFFTGGQAYTVTTTINTTVSTNNGSTTTTTVTKVDNNCITMGEGRLSLTKVGANTQSFTGNVYLDQVHVKEGELQMIGDITDITSMTVYDGAKVTTGENVTLGTLTLCGGSSWYTLNDNPNSYNTTLYLSDVFNDGAANGITIGANDVEWVPAMYVNMANAGTWTENAGAIFKLDNVTLDLDALRVLTNLSGIKGGDKIAMYDLTKAPQHDYSALITASQNNVLVMVEDVDGNFYDAHYEQIGNIIYLHLADVGHTYGIEINKHSKPYQELIGYIWSGETNGTTIDDVHHLNQVLGSVWRADGSAENTGWHEQRAVDSSNNDIGKYVDGNTVYFLDTDVHNVVEEHRMVDIVGHVAPGQIIINANENAGFLNPSEEDAEYHVEYAYAFVSKDGSGCITDYVDAKGNVTPTSVTMQGTGLVVMNLYNTFSGGIDVQNGGLYLATVGAAGTGALTFHTDKEWSFNVQGQSTGVVNAVMNRVGAELMICYQHSDDAVSGFRGSTLRNDIILNSTSENDVAGRFKVSFAYAAFNESASGDKNLSNIPRHWRNLTLSGALTGAGYYTGEGDDKTWVNTSGNDVLELTGYCSTWTNTRDQSYVTSLTMNEDTAGEHAYIKDANGQIVNRFQGTVVLMNTVNTSPLPSNELSKRTAGTVQLVLKGDKFSQAHVDLTRESVYMGKQNFSYEDSDSTNWNRPRQTYNNIMVLNGDTKVNGLSAKFHGSGWYYPENDTTGNSTINNRNFIANMAQNDEVWHVRTLTNGLNTLSIGTYGDTSNNSTYVYSGAMGFAQAYAGTSEAHVPWGDGFMEHTAEGWYFGGHSMATESLSLTKSSNSSQYIHTAKLNDVSLYEGVLGFNSLELKGNLNLVGGTNLKLGVTGSMADKTTWDKITKDSTSGISAEYAKVHTSPNVTVDSGKTLTVFTPYVKDAEPTTAVVNGNVVMSSGSTLTFLPNGILPDYTYDKASTPKVNPYLDVNAIDGFDGSDGSDESGILYLPGELGENGAWSSSSEHLTITLTGVDFAQALVQDRENTFFYLAEADNIVVGTDGDSSTFMSRIISLGYGYYGVLDTLDSSREADDQYKSPDTKDYLVIRVFGDPRCTWSGKVKVDVLDTEGNIQTVEPGHIWVHTEGGASNYYDYRWKENNSFENGMTVLFGNLYEPVEWTWDKTNLTSVQTTVVDLNKLQPGHPAKSVTIDGHDIVYSNVPSDKQASYTYENVVISGRVAPLSVVINADYFDKARNTYKDSTNYIFTSGDNGYIDNAQPDELKIWEVEDPSWETSVTKLGTGTTIMTTDNRYTGGTEILGGRIVMQHVNALGFVYNTGAYATPDDTTDDGYNLDDKYAGTLLPGLDCTITLMNGGELMGDFKDSQFPGNHEENITTSQGSAIETTTIRNKVVLKVYADPNTPDFASKVDGRIFNNTAHKLVLTTLEGESQTVLEFAGVGLTADQSMKQYQVDNMFRYGVFKVLNPGNFYGTVQLTGKHWAASNSGATYDLVNGGQVQLNIMSSAKSGSNDWTNATVDLSIKDGTNRTVLGLDAMGVADDSVEYAYLNSIQGTTAGGSSSVLNMSAHNPLTLVITGSRNGEYDGVMGYGDFEVSVDYGGYAGLHGSTQHHYGAVGHGSLNLIKQGDGSIQTAGRAWLNSVEVQGGTFLVHEALVAHDLTSGGGKRIMVGDVDKSTLYGLTVGKGGTLAMNTSFDVTGTKQDAWAGVSAGTTVGDSTTPAGWVLLEDGATLSAREDWYTRKKVDIETNASVTINTHNFIIDPELTVQFKKENDVFGKYDHSHIIQLLGEVSGRNVHLTLNNQLTDPTKGDAYVNLTVDSPYMGYVALNDLNDLRDACTVDVGSMTVLQILNANDGVKADVDITVAGKNATVQILDNVVKYNDANQATVTDNMVQYIDRIEFGVNRDTDVTKDPLHRENNGQLLLGGTELTTLGSGRSSLDKPHMDDMQVVISSRHNNTTLAGVVENLNVDMRGSAVSLGGEAGKRTTMENVHVDMARSDVKHTIHHTDLVNSMVHLMEDCSVDISDALLVDKNSVIRGVTLPYGEADANGISHVIGNPVVPYVDDPNKAVGLDDTAMTKEVNTSVNTTVQLTFADEYGVYKSDNGTNLVVLLADQFMAVDVTGNGLTIELHEDMFQYGYNNDARFIGVMMGGNSGRFYYENDLAAFRSLLDSQFVLRDSKGEQITGRWVTSTYVKEVSGADYVSPHLLYFETPEPTTTTLSLVALTALMARRRRKS